MFNPLGSQSIRYKRKLAVHWNTAGADRGRPALMVVDILVVCLNWCKTQVVEDRPILDHGLFSGRV